MGGGGGNRGRGRGLLKFLALKGGVAGRGGGGRRVLLDRGKG